MSARIATIKLTGTQWAEQQVTDADTVIAEWCGIDQYWEIVHPDEIDGYSVHTEGPDAADWGGEIITERAEVGDWIELTGEKWSSSEDQYGILMNVRGHVVQVTGHQDDFWIEEPRNRWEPEFLLPDGGEAAAGLGLGWDYKKVDPPADTTPAVNGAKYRLVVDSVGSDARVDVTVYRKVEALSAESWTGTAIEEHEVGSIHCSPENIKWKVTAMIDADRRAREIVAQINEEYA